MTSSGPGRIKVATVGAVSLVAFAAVLLPTAAPTVAAPMSGFTYVTGSTKEVCQLTGEIDYQTGKKYKGGGTETGYGLEAADAGNSFEYNGQVWWLFGDAIATAKFDKMPNRASRYPSKNVVDNDAMAYSGTPPRVCPKLHFVPQTTAAVGAYTSPSLVLPTGQEVSLRTNEAPVAGIEEFGKMYVIFKTGNERTELSTGHGNLASISTESVMGVLEDPSTLRFDALYALSAPTKPFLPGARFVNVAIEPSVEGDGYLYIWGTGPLISSAGKESASIGPVYLARMQASDIGTAGPTGLPQIDYYTGLAADGSPNWLPDTGATSQNMAVPLFPADCAHTIGVQWNEFADSWVMLYDCHDTTPGHPAGIYMRSAPQPWGPWSAPQTIFDPAPDLTAQTGFCYFIYTLDQSECPAGSPEFTSLENAPSPGKNQTPQIGGSYYGPYFITKWTTGSPATTTAQASSTFYYTLDTYRPYGQVILQSTIKWGPLSPPPKPVPPTCTGTKCM